MSQEIPNKPELTIDVTSHYKESIELNTSLSTISEETTLTDVKVNEVKVEVEETKKEVSFQDQHDNIIKDAIINLFKNKDKLKVATALDIISMIMEIAEKIFLRDPIAKKNLVLSIIERISKGLDGIEGTSDDIISQETMNTIRVLLQNNLIEGIINGLIKVSKQLFNFNKTNKKWCCF
jgi:hypothetical protein